MVNSPAISINPKALFATIKVAVDKLPDELIAPIATVAGVVVTERPATAL
jgi:hypothetical protein